MNNKVIEYIKANGTPKSPVSSYEITEALGISGISIRKAINKARSEGCPICACGNGYYYSTDKDDIVSTIQSLVSRNISVEKAINGLLTNLKNIESEETNVESD